MTQKRLEQIAEKHGAELDWEDEHVTAWLDDGQIWEESLTQSMSVRFADGRHSWKKEAFADLADRMEQGTDLE